MNRPSLPTRRVRRHLVQAVAIGTALSISPVFVGSAPTIAHAAPSRAVGLEQGERGDAVRSLQQALVNQGVDVQGGVDGIFGPGTKAALVAFQKNEGLGATGTVDEATALALGLSSSPSLGLAQGARGDAVIAMQKALINAGYWMEGGHDGIFGPATVKVLEAFQKAKGLAVTGQVDAATTAALGLTSSGSSGSTGSSPAAAASNSGSSSLVGLSIGARGDAVKEVQRLIMNAGVNLVGGDDGIFGALTSSALRSFQEANGLSANGVVGQSTLDALRSGSGSSNNSTSVAGLSYGATGAAVKELQQKLMNTGLTLRGGADGIFGSATRDVLRKYQSINGLSQSGSVDAATAKLLGGGSSGGGGSTAASGNGMLGLEVGALGSAVEQLQRAMMNAGVDVRGGADGIFGPATNSALKSFQTSQGLSATGVVDEATVRALASPQALRSGSTSGGYASYGEKGQRVRELQSALVNAGIALRGGVDGDFGSGTAAGVMAFQRAVGMNATGKVNDATAASLGLAAMQAPKAPNSGSVKMRAFPVQRPCYYGDTWQNSRSGGRTHLGVDIIAGGGQAIYAVADGEISKIYKDHPGSLAGNGVRLTTSDGTYFFYAHMSKLGPGIQRYVDVKAGQVIGYIGKTGNTGTNHLHLEIHPGGGSAVNPYPLVKAIDAC